MDPYLKLKEMIGLPTEGHTPLIENSKIAVNKDVLRSLHEHTLQKEEENIVVGLISTYREWYDANLDVLHALVNEASQGGSQTQTEKPSHDDSERQS